MGRFLLLLLLAVALLAGCGEDGTPAAGGDGELARLVIRVDPDGDGSAPARELELTCQAPTDSQACGAAAGLSAAELAPTPAGTACTQIYGGPETASIRGTLRGNDVDATFTRTDGCEIERWEGVAPLLDQVK